MISRNLRHLRVYLKVAELNSLTGASELCSVSQPAVTQAIGKLERDAGGTLFERTRSGFYLTPRGTVLAARLRRAFAILDPALTEVAPRLQRVATTAQLEALVAMREAENFTLAARRLGIAQPTVHRAVTQLEREAARALFERTSFGMVATRQCQALARAARLAFYELDQADADLAEFDGREGGHIVIGALPLSRSVMLPRALSRFRMERPTLPVTVLDGSYDELLAGLRRGEIDFIIGALRFPALIGDIDQEVLFDDDLAILCGVDHPLAGQRSPSLADLAAFPWVVPRRGTPTRTRFDLLFEPLGETAPSRIIEAGSLILMREILAVSDHLGCISLQQAAAEIARGLIVRVDFAVDGPGRAIGLTYRRNWTPTVAQKLMLDLVRAAAPDPRAL